MKEESLLLLSDLQKLINQVVLIDYTIIILGGIFVKDKATFQNKVKVLNKLFDSGCDTEKKLQQLDMEAILKIPNITIPDMGVIMELQKNTKSGKLFSYLGGGSDETVKSNNEKKEPAMQEQR